MTDPGFVAVPAGEDAVAELGALLPDNAFATSGYFEARRLLGYAGWVLGLRRPDGDLECGCGAFLRTRRLNRTLEIPSLPGVGATSAFWHGLFEFCRDHRVTKVMLDTYGSPSHVAIPPLGAACAWRSRCEFLLHLEDNVDDLLERRHRQHVRKAQKAGLVVRRTTSVEAVSAHRAMMAASMDRRRARGERVPSVAGPLGFTTLLRSGAGELYQVLREETVLGSGLVLRAPEGAYFDSRGTSPDGMAMGASHLLILGIMRQLSADGVRVFNLGGAEEGSSLARFKKKFGASLVPLPSATCYVGPPWRRRMNRCLELLRSDRHALLRAFGCRVSRLTVYAADTEEVPPPDTRPGVTLRALAADDLRTPSAGDHAFHERQLERLARFGGSHAYGVFVDGEVAHVSWLLPAAAMAKDAPQWLRAREDEVEITCAETLPGYRGRGLYAFAIRRLVHIAHQEGARRVFMKAQTDNEAARRGIEKAGLAQVGSVAFMETPLLPTLVIWRSRGRTAVTHLPLSSTVTSVGASPADNRAAGS